MDTGYVSPEFLRELSPQRFHHTERIDIKRLIRLLLFIYISMENSRQLFKRFLIRSAPFHYICHLFFTALQLFQQNIPDSRLIRLTD